MRNAFTLIEILVVVSVIPLLLALLMPGLDRAMYQAELAQCAGKLDAVGSGLVTGAMENRRQFPNRLVRWHPINVNLPKSLAIGGDDRPAIRNYLRNSLNTMLNDPLM